MNFWTVGALKGYVDQRFRSSETALTKAETALNLRLEGMNEFRAQLQHERGALVTKAEYDQRHDSLEVRMHAGDEKLGTRVTSLERWQAKLVGAMALVVLLTPILTGLVVWYVTHHHAP